MMVSHDEIQAYTDELRGALARMGMAPAEAEQVVAEVVSHVEDTGERPVEAFGPAGVYAAQYAGAPAPVVIAATPPADRRPDDGVATWVKVVVAMAALMFAPFLVMAALAPLFMATGGSGGREVLTVVALWLAVAGLVWWAVRRYRRRPGSSTAGAWVVGVLVLLVLGGLGTGLAGLLTFQAAATVSCTMVDGVETCTDGPGGGSPLALHPAELAMLAVPALLLVALVVAVVRGLRARR